MIDIPICNLGSQVDPAWNTTVKFVQRQDQLPIPDSIINLYLDFETTSGDKKIKSIHPNRHCKILGAAVLFDSEPSPYYIPVRHRIDDGIPYRDQIDLQVFYDWLRIIVNKSKNWINHNLKYDVHVYINELHSKPECNLICTLNESKLASLTEKFNYSLDVMMKEAGVDITPYEAGLKSFLGKDKDYGVIPPDRMAEYAGVDVLSVRHLRKFLEPLIGPDVYRVRQLESDILPMLVDMEQTGVRLDPIPTFTKWKEILPKQTARIKKIKELTGLKKFDPSSKKSLHELFCETLGWELDFTAKSIEKFTKGIITEDEMTLSYGYASLMKHERKNPELVKTFIDYQEDEKLLTGFIIPYLEEHFLEDGIIKCTYTQIKRTGRMSCGDPNMQQLPPSFKYFIIPYSEDYVLVIFDLSQIEFRVIVHYINNRKAIEAYLTNPKTDFHDWVAMMCNIPRKPAKSVNFMLGYGGGKGKCVTMLSELPEIVQNLQDSSAITMRATEVYNSYHAALPELKPTGRRAANVLLARGYVKTGLGRHRHLPPQVCYKAFNSVCQGTAADIQKDITIRLGKFLSQDCILHALVHDSWLFSIRKDRVNELVPEIKYEIERPIEGLDFSVPIISNFGISDKNWREADLDADRRSKEN